MSLQRHFLEEPGAALLDTSWAALLVREEVWSRIYAPACYSRLCSWVCSSRFAWSCTSKSSIARTISSSRTSFSSLTSMILEVARFPRDASQWFCTYFLNLSLIVFRVSPTVSSKILSGNLFANTFTAFVNLAWDSILRDIWASKRVAEFRRTTSIAAVILMCFFSQWQYLPQHVLL